jgi:hypothetical protein
MTACDFTGDWIKEASRDRNIQLYKSLVAPSIPDNRTYITMSGYQSATDSETSKIVESRFVDIRRVIGIDTSKAAVISNRASFPNGYWVHGRWKKVFPYIANIPWKPGFVYLDTTYWAGNDKLIEDINHTLPFCTKDTLVVINACNRCPRKKNTTMDCEDFLNKISTQIDLSAWNVVDNYHYKRKSSRVGMLTISLLRIS